jgi:hypothetical protein
VELSNQLAAVKWLGFAVTGISGTLLFMSDATRFYTNPSFVAKVILLLLIAVNAWFVRSAIKRGAQAPRAAGYVSLALWICVIAASRAIGFTLPDV